MLVNRISKIISKIKGNEWMLDSTLTNSQVLKIVLLYLGMFLRGAIMFRTITKNVFVGKRAKVVSLKSIKSCNKLLIGRYCYIDATSEEGIYFGNNVSIGKNTTIECSGTLQNIGRGLTVGNNVGMGSQGFWGCAGGIKVGDDTIFGNFVSLHSENHIFEHLDIPIRKQGVTRAGILIGSNCWIGAKVTILDGVEIGDNSIVAAGAVVLKGKYPKNSIIAGVPAKIIRTR